MYPNAGINIYALMCNARNNEVVSFPFWKHNSSRYNHRLIWRCVHKPLFLWKKLQVGSVGVQMNFHI